MLASPPWAGSRSSRSSRCRSLRFPTSGSPAAQPAFLRGVTALHNFQYEDAVEAFREAQRIDRDFAMAYWGEAMACNQTLWLNQDAATARESLLRLGPTPEARVAKAPTAREKDYLRAVEILFGSGERAARDRAYAEAMGKLAAAYPEDLEASTFHALALMGTAARSPALFNDGGDDAHAACARGQRDPDGRWRPSCSGCWPGSLDIRARSTT